MFSKELFSSVSVNVILPTPESGDYFFGSRTYYPKAGQKYQTLYLLHGFTADFSDWQRFSSIERYAQERQIAVVMPGVDNSFYCNLPEGGNYYDYYTRELPQVMEALFPISGKRENKFLAGLSMGGYGAFKAALREPDQYAAAVSLSGGMSCGAGEGWACTIGSASPDEVPTGRFSRAAFGEHNEYLKPEEGLLFSDAISWLFYAKEVRMGPCCYPQCYVRSRLHLLDYETLCDAAQKLAENRTRIRGNALSYAAKVLFSCLTECGAGLALDPDLNEMGEYPDSPY